MYDRRREWYRKESNFQTLKTSKTNIRNVESNLSNTAKHIQLTTRQQWRDQKYQHWESIG